jgi:protein ImuA
MNMHLQRFNMIAHLRQRLLALQKPPKIQDGSGVLPFGIAAIDTMLGGGLMRGALHEIAAPAETHSAAATGFALGISSSWPGLSRPSTSCLLTLPEVVDARHKAGHDGRRIVWIAEEMARTESGVPHGAGLDAFGLAPERLVTVTVSHRRDLLWGMEEALRCRAVGVVIGEMRPGKIDEIAVRRLSLAAGESDALALLLRAAPAADSSTAATRWIVGAAPSFVIPEREPFGERTRNPETDSEIASGFRIRRFAPFRNDEEIRPRFAAHLARNRRGPVGSWILEWSDSDERFILATHAQPVAAPAFDRPHRQVA